MVSFDRPPVLYGDKLTAASHPRLATKLIPYDQLKQTLRRLDPDSDSHSAIEGIFLTQLLSAINLMQLLPHVSWLTQPVAALLIAAAVWPHVFLRTLSEARTATDQL